MGERRKIGVGEDGLTTAERSLARRVADLERQLGEEVDRRDAAEEWADKLAYAIAGPDVIGEHSNTNSPWANALEIVVSRRVAAGPQTTTDQVIAEAEGTVRHSYSEGPDADRCTCCPGAHVYARQIDGIEGAARCDWLWEQFRTLPEGTRLIVRVVAVPTDHEDPA